MSAPVQEIENLARSGQWAQARLRCAELCSQTPGDVRLWQMAAGIDQQLGRFNEARQHYERALQIKPDLIDALLGLCHVWSALERPDEVIACLNKAIAIKPQAYELHYNLALTLESMGRLEEAYQACTSALQLNREYFLATTLQASVRRRQHRYQEAVELLDPLINKGIRHPRVADAFVTLCHKVDRCDEALALSKQICASNNTVDQDMMCLRFSTGHALDRLGRYDEAFDNFHRANRMRNVNSDVSDLQRLSDKIIAMHQSDPGRQYPAYEPGTPRLIFIIGMPRSGTTLAEQILASHPDTYGAGELNAMPDVSHSVARLTGTNGNYPGCMSELDEEKIKNLRQAYLSRLPDASHGIPVVIDKQPGNFLSVGLIRAVFPDASIIHCTRDPHDTCLSCYFNNFRGLPYTYDLTALGRTWRIYRELMDHWQALSIPMLDLSYEALVDDVDAHARALVEYCGLHWDDTCLRFHDNKRAVATVSHDQVSQPIYKGSVNRWRNYAQHLAPLLSALQISE